MSDDRERDLLEDDLEAWLAGEDTPGGEWEIDAQADGLALEAMADRLLYRIGRAQRELTHLAALADERRRPINQWQKDREAGPLRSMERDKAALEAVTRRLVALDPKRKTLNLPAGKAKLTAPGASSLVVDDEDALVKWLEEHHPDQVEVVITKKWAGKAEVKKLVKAVDMSEEETAGADPDKKLSWAFDKASGELVPGVHIEEPAVDRFGYELAAPRVTDTPSA